MAQSQTGLRNRMNRPRSTQQQNAPDVFAAPKRKRRYLGNPMRLKNKSAKTACLQILFSIGIVVIYFYFTTKPSTKCTHSDPMCPNKYFSDSYNQAREQFLFFSSQIHEATTYNLPIIEIKSESEYGVKQTLYTDVTVINSNAKQSDHLIIHMSGIHGIEAYVGSAIQCAILHKMSEMRVDNNDNNNNTNSKDNKYKAELMDHMMLNRQKKKWINHNDNEKKSDDYNMNDFPVIMFVHALNPFGMYYGLRVNENNVDLNRNLKTDKQWKQFLKDETKPNDEIHDFLNPNYGITNMVINTDKYVLGARFFKLNWVIQYIWSYVINWYLKTKLFGHYILQYKFDYLDSDMEMDTSELRNELFERYTVGQTYDANGLQYIGAGNHKEKSHIIFMDFLSQQFEQNEWHKQFKKITLIDVHSGFGRYGYDTLTVSDDKHLKEIQKIGKTFRIPTMIQTTHYKNEGFANGIYKNVNGMSYQYMDFIVDELMNNNNNISVDKLGLLQHFGTYPMQHMLNAIRFHHSYHREYKQYLENMNENNQQEKRILKLIQFMKQYSSNTLKNAFYVTDLKWRRQVIRAGYDLFVALYRR